MLGQNLIKALIPVCTGRCRLKGLVVRSNKLTIRILHRYEIELVLLDISVFQIPNRIGQATYESRDAFVTFSARSNWPVHSGAFADFGFPLGIYFGQIVREDEGRAGTISAAYRSDICVRQIHAGVESLDGCIVPLGNFAQIDITQHLTVQTHLARVKTANVDDGDDTANDGGKLHQVFLGKLIIFQRSI